MIGSSFQNHKICTLLIGYSDIVRKSKSMKPIFMTERSQVLPAVSDWPLRLLEIRPAHPPGDEDEYWPLRHGAPDGECRTVVRTAYYRVDQCRSCVHRL